MRNNNFLKISLVSLICWPLLSCAMAGNSKTLPELVSNQVESIFSVDKQNLKIQKGDKATSENDNAFLLSALELENILIKDYAYTVHVSRKQYSYSDGLEADLELFHYTIEFKDQKTSLKTILPILADSDFIETYIPLSKAPTRCYSFIAEQKLHLLCHYGLKRKNSIPEIISHLKKN